MLPTRYLGALSKREMIFFPKIIIILIFSLGLNDRHEKGFDLRTKFKNFLKSAVIETRAYPIRFIFIADILSVFQIDKIFQDVLPPFELTNQVNNSR